MAQYNLNAYDADVWITEFKGLMPQGDHIGDDVRYAEDALNVETPAGVLMPVAPPYKLYTTETPIPDGAAYFATGNVSLMKVKYNIPAYGTSGSAIIILGDNEGNLYRWYSRTWLLLGEATTYKGGPWRYTTYEKSVENVGVKQVLILSNINRGVFYYEMTNGTINPYVSESLTAITTPVRFFDIARYRERIWGCGRIGANPDAIYYSKPYDFETWSSSDTDIPEDGAGMIRIPTWDGELFTALIPFGDCLLCFKNNTIWKISGSDPSNFYINQLISVGTDMPGTIQVVGNKILFCREDGMYSFDGVEAKKIFGEITDQFWHTKRFNVTKSATLSYDKTRYLVLAGGVQTGQTNPYMLIYNIADGTLVLRNDIYVTALCPYNDIVIMKDPEDDSREVMRHVVFDSWTPTDVGAYNWEGGNPRSTGAATKWASPWIDLGRKTIQKGGFEVYFTPEVKFMPVTFLLSIETEKKIKTKTVTIRSTTLGGARTKRVHFGGSGRRFRLIIETKAGNTNPWRLIGGIHIVTETDVD